MKKIIISIILILSLFTITACTNEKKDSFNLKEEYESLNNKKDASGNKYRKVSIDEDNPYVHITAEEIVEKIKNKETFYVYFGDKMCPWCRSVIEKSIEVAKDNNINTIYYIDIWDDDHNEILRDKYELNDNNEKEQTVKGTEAYYKLLKYFDNLLKDYNLTDSDGNIVETGEKRIYAPSFVYIKKGKAKKLVEGTSSIQKDSREELTEEMLKEEKKIFKNFFDNK